MQMDERKLRILRAIIDDYKDVAEFHLFDSFIEERKKEVKAHAN